MIAQIAFEGMKTLVITLRERAERFRNCSLRRNLITGLQPNERCKGLRITKRDLQYYCLEGIVPSPSLDNKGLFKESDDVLSRISLEYREFRQEMFRVIHLRSSLSDDRHRKHSSNGTV